MKATNLTEEEFEIIRQILRWDFENIANDLSFFEESEKNPKEYIDKRIAIGQKFNMDFWNVIDLYCNDFQKKGLTAIYNGVTFKEFCETYIIPNEAKLAADFYKALVKNKSERNKEH